MMNQITESKKLKKTSWWNTFYFIFQFWDHPWRNPQVKGTACKSKTSMFSESLHWQDYNAQKQFISPVSLLLMLKEFINSRILFYCYLYIPWCRPERTFPSHLCQTVLIIPLPSQGILSLSRSHLPFYEINQLLIWHFSIYFRVSVINQGISTLMIDWVSFLLCLSILLLHYSQTLHFSEFAPLNLHEHLCHNLLLIFNVLLFS